MPGDPSLKDRTPIWQPSDLSAALGWLTALPLRRPDLKSEAFARAAVAFPLVGVLMGGTLAGLNWVIADRLPHWLAGAVLVAVWEGIRWDPDENAGWLVPGAAAAAKFAGLWAQAATQPAALLFAPLLACWGMVVLAAGARDADAPGQKFNTSITFREFALASVFTFVVVFALAEATGMFVVVCVAALTLGLRLLAHRWGGGVSWRFLRASAAVIEAFVIALFALL